MIAALKETPIGRALLLYWEYLPLWTLGNMALIVSLVPSFLVWTTGLVGLALALSFPAALVIAGLTSLMAKPVVDRVPRWSDLRDGHYITALSAWLAVVTIAQTFALPGLLVQCVLAILVLLLAPTAMCLPALYPANLPLCWRNALVIAVHFPWVALGMAALALLFAWLVVLSRGALLLALPTLCLAIMLVSLNEITLELTGSE